MFWGTWWQWVRRRRGGGEEGERESAGAGIGHYNSRPQADNLTSRGNVELIEKCYVQSTVVYSCTLMTISCFFSMLYSNYTDWWLFRATNNYKHAYTVQSYYSEGQVKCMSSNLQTLRHLIEEMCARGGREMDEMRTLFTHTHSTPPCITLPYSVGPHYFPCAETLQCHVTAVLQWALYKLFAIDRSGIDLDTIPTT